MEDLGSSIQQALQLSVDLGAQGRARRSSYSSEPGVGEVSSENCCEAEHGREAR